MIGFRSTEEGGGKRRRTALTRRARSPLAAFRQALLPERTALTIGLVGQIDSTLGERIFLADFAQPEACPCWTAQPPILLQDEGLSPETAPGSSERCSPLPRSILLRWVFRSQQQRRPVFGRGPLEPAQL